MPAHSLPPRKRGAGIQVILIFPDVLPPLKKLIMRHIFLLDTGDV